MKTEQKPAVTSGPWWKHGLMWLVVGGPAAVIVAGVATTFVALHSPDPVVADDYYRRGMEINKTMAARDKALLPAQQGRNHAATPARPE
jgi:hypothetical protein